MRPPDDEVIYRLLSSCSWPGEAFWRVIELAPLRDSPALQRPILEVGCGEGGITEELGIEIDHAIDLNPRAAEVAAARPNYHRVEVIDMHDLADREDARYMTVLANSVLEHVVGLPEALRTIHTLLEPGGALVTTVPLKDMNEHLTLDSERYVAWRQGRLEHRNLWTRDEWREQLREAGFGEVSFTGYLDAAEIGYWDRIDAIGNVGIGRVRVAPVARRGVSAVLPDAAKRRVKRAIAERLARHVDGGGEESCAALVVARA